MKILRIVLLLLILIGLGLIATNKFWVPSLVVLLLQEEKTPTSNGQVAPSLTNAQTETQGAFVGLWTWKSANGGGEFELELRKGGTNEIVGDFCAVAQHGNRIDCGDNALSDSHFTENIHGTITQGVLSVTFTDYYNNGEGAAELTLTPNRSLTWKVTHKPEGDQESYVPVLATLTKK